MSERVCLGVIVGAHGVRGQVRLKSFAEEETALADYGPLEDDGGQPVRLSLTGKAKGVLIAKIVGVADRDAAQALKGTNLFVARDALPAAEEDEFYHADLIGLRVDHVDGTEVGTVVAVHDFGAGDLIDVRLAGARKTVLLPFDRDTVPEVDLAAGRLLVDPMPGLLEDPEDGEEEDEETDNAPEGTAG